MPALSVYFENVFRTLRDKPITNEDRLKLIIPYVFNLRGFTRGDSDFVNAENTVNSMYPDLNFHFADDTFVNSFKESIVSAARTVLDRLDSNLMNRFAELSNNSTDRFIAIASRDQDFRTFLDEVSEELINGNYPLWDRQIVQRNIQKGINGFPDLSQISAIMDGMVSPEIRSYIVDRVPFAQVEQTVPTNEPTVDNGAVEPTVAEPLPFEITEENIEEKPVEPVVEPIVETVEEPQTTVVDIEPVAPESPNPEMDEVEPLFPEVDNDAVVNAAPEIVEAPESVVDVPAEPLDTPDVDVLPMDLDDNGEPVAPSVDEAEVEQAIVEEPTVTEELNDAPEVVEDTTVKEEDAKLEEGQKMVEVLENMTENHVGHNLVEDPDALLNNTPVEETVDIEPVVEEPDEVEPIEATIFNPEEEQDIPDVTAVKPEEESVKKNNIVDANSVSEADISDMLSGFSSDTALNVVNDNPAALRWTKQDFRTSLEAVSLNGMALEYIKKPNFFINRAAVRENGRAIKFVKHQSRSLRLDALKQTQFAIYDLNSPKPAELLMAINKNYDAMRFNQTPGLTPENKLPCDPNFVAVLCSKYSSSLNQHICNELVKIDPHNFAYIPSRFKTTRMCKNVVAQAPFNIQHVPLNKLTDKLWNTAVDLNAKTIALNPNPSYELCGRALENDRDVFGLLPQNVQQQFVKDFGLENRSAKGGNER